MLFEVLGAHSGDVRGEELSILPRNILEMLANEMAAFCFCPKNWPEALLYKFHKQKPSQNSLV